MSLRGALRGPKSRERHLPPWLYFIDRFLHVFEVVFGLVGAIALVLLVVNTTANAILRSFFAVQIPGSLNITVLYLVPAIVFLGLIVVQANDAHIAATLVVERLGANSQRVCTIIVNLMIAVSCYFLAVGAWGELLDGWGTSLGGSPNLPVGPTWIFVPIGFFFVGLRALHQVVVLCFYPKAAAVSDSQAELIEEGVPHNA